ncbi:MAG: hypothetical protein QXN16_01920 [Candidatus Micrarchaeaceae archaeon]
MEKYSEGKAVIEAGKAFLNPAAKLTRDIGVAVAKWMFSGKAYSVLDGTAATGIRGIRYRKEGGAAEVAFVEMNMQAYRILKKNLHANGLSDQAFNESFQEFANTSERRFDIVDLDPFGGITPLAYDSIKVARSGGAIFATATDTAVLCGAHYNACIRLYNAMPMHNELCKEAGMRILIGYMARIAAGFNFGIESMLSMAYKHYMRVHLKLAHGSKSALASIRNLGFMSSCQKCGFVSYEEGIPEKLICPNCGAKMKVAGPLWLGRLKDEGLARYAYEFAEKNFPEDASFLAKIAGEFDTPLYYSIPALTKKLGRSSAKPSSIIDAIRNSGYKASLAHYDDEGIKTNAPFKVLLDELKNMP